MTQDQKRGKLLYRLSSAQTHLDEAAYWIKKIYHDNPDITRHADEAFGAALMIAEWIKEIKKEMAA